MTTKLEEAYQSGRTRVDIDKERFVDMSNKNLMLQRRKDDENKRRNVTRREIDATAKPAPAAPAAAPKASKPKAKPKAKKKKSSSYSSSDSSSSGGSLSDVDISSSSSSSSSSAKKLKAKPKQAQKAAPKPAKHPAPKPAPAPAPAPKAHHIPKGIDPIFYNIVKFVLSKGKVDAKDKTLLRQQRKEHNVDEDQFLNVVASLGWTEAEWDEGQKKPDYDLEEEHKLLQEPNSFEIIRIKANAQKKDEEALFAKVCSKFFNTMSKAQGNYQITEVGLIVNSKARHEYNEVKRKFEELGKELNEDFGFHGTSRAAIEGIAKTNFLHPNEFQTKGKNDASKKKATKKKGIIAKPEIEALDDGYFGKGIYFTRYSDYAVWYSDERDSDQVLLSKLITGTSYHCQARMDGADCVPGYDSHLSPKKNEIIIFDKRQILPLYTVTFKVNEEKEREQED